MGYTDGFLYQTLRISAFENIWLADFWENIICWPRFCNIKFKKNTVSYFSNDYHIDLSLNIFYKVIYKEGDI